MFLWRSLQASPEAFWLFIVDAFCFSFFQQAPKHNIKKKITDKIKSTRIAARKKENL